MRADASVRPDDTERTARRVRIVFAVLFVHGLAFAISDYTAPDTLKRGFRELYSVFAFLPLQLGSVYALHTAASRTELDPGTRRALRWVAYGFCALAAGSVIAIVSWMTGHKLPYISWADLVYYQLYPGLILGARALPSLKRRVSRARSALDTAVVVMAFGALIVFAAMFETTAIRASVAERVVAALYSGAQLVTLLFINGAVERAQRTPSAR